MKLYKNSTGTKFFGKFKAGPTLDFTLVDSATDMISIGTTNGEFFAVSDSGTTRFSDTDGVTWFDGDNTQNTTLVSSGVGLVMALTNDTRSEWIDSAQGLWTIMGNSRSRWFAMVCTSDYNPGFAHHKMVGTSNYNPGFAFNGADGEWQWFSDCKRIGTWYTATTGGDVTGIVWEEIHSPGFYNSETGQALLPNGFMNPDFMGTPDDFNTQVHSDQVFDISYDYFVTQTADVIDWNGNITNTGIPNLEFIAGYGDYHIALSQGTSHAITVDGGGTWTAVSFDFGVITSIVVSGTTFIVTSDTGIWRWSAA